MMTVVHDQSLVGVPNPVKFGLGVFTFASGGLISYMIQVNILALLRGIHFIMMAGLVLLSNK